MKLAIPFHNITHIAHPKKKLDLDQYWQSSFKKFKILINFKLFLKLNNNKININNNFHNTNTVKRKRKKIQFN